jgi:NAD(P)-dependent dehydrogenase (short-subunit alcohol dehydrogenase family)
MAYDRPMELGGKTTIVTGAASGIGEALAEAFVAEGAKAVIVADRDEKGAKAVAERLGEVATGVGLDVADEEAIKAMVADTEAAHGPIDVFVSNAGYGLRGGLDLPNDEWTRMMDVHVWSHLYAARAVVPSMVERGEGYLLNTASAAGLLTQMDSGPYAVSKHAAVALAEWLAINYGDKGVRVSVLCPQAVRTNILGNRARVGDDSSSRQAGQDGVLEPEDAARACLDAMREERFLVLPHPQVETYFQRKASDYDRWLAGMRRFRRRLMGDA